MLVRTERLVLREYVPEDWAAVHAYRRDLRYQRFYPPAERTEDEARAFVEAQIACQQEQPRRQFQLAVTLA